MSFFVYMLRTSKGTLYTGQTNNLKKRLKEHKEKKGKGAKYTRSFDSVQLVYSEICQNRSIALKREAQIKKMTKTQKEAIIAIMAS